MLNAIKNARKKAWIIIGVSVALVLGSAAMVWIDSGKIKEEEQKIVGLRTENTKADGRIAKIKDIEERVLRERLVVKEYVKILPDDKDINDFVERITEFARNTGVEIESLDDRSARNRNARKSADAFVKINYTLELRGDVNQCLDFMQRFETYDRFVAVKALHIRNDAIVARGDESYEAPRHKITVELETYVYQPTQKGKAPVNIINADKRMYAIAQTQPAAGLSLDTYEWVSSADRRDPFADPRRDAVSDGTNDEQQDVEAQVATLDRLVEDFAKIREGIDEEATIESWVKQMEFTRRLDEMMVTFNKEVEGLKESKFFTKRELRSRFSEEVSEPFELLFTARAERRESTIRFHQITAEYKRMSIAFSEERYDDVVRAAEAIQGAPGVDTEDSKMQKILAEVRTLAVRAVARMEFAQKEFSISGFVYQPSLPEKAVVIINNRAYSPGDVLDDGVVVGRIDQARVVFLYKKEEFEQLLD